MNSPKFCRAHVPVVLIAFMILFPAVTSVFAEASSAMGSESEPGLWPGKTVITAAAFEGIFSVSQEDGDIVHGYGARASLGCVGVFAQQLALDAAIGYRWLESPDGPVPFPGAFVSGGWRIPFHNLLTLTPLGGVSLDVRFDEGTPEAVPGIMGGVRFAFLLSRRDYVTLTPSVTIPVSGNASPAVSLAIGVRSESAWMVPIPDKAPGIRAKPELFSPDGDGLDDETVLFLSSPASSYVSGWSVSVLGKNDTVLMTQEGTGIPPESIVWNGGNDPEAIEPGMVYRAVFETVDILGRHAQGETTITCDILVIQDGERYRVRVPNIIFPSDSWELSPRESGMLLEANRRVLERVATLFSRFPSYSLTVEGYANAVYRDDPVRYAEEQQKELLPLSQKRADTVRDALIMLGIDSARITTKAFGGERPKTTVRASEEAWKNRRVEFILER